ncbi:MAG: holo-ACP synthase [Eubacterium sp.]|nr:holo-ACP synthase [Eubacterium sp.]
MKMFKIGTDIIRISRIEKSLEKEHFKASVFTSNEILYCKNAESFAGIFAAKEAYFKAKGTGINKRLNSIEISHDEKGKPFIVGVENSDVSISHDGDYAIASVILWEKL